MNCPDIDRLIDLYHGLRDPALENHLRSCSSCQADMEILLLLPEAFAFDEEVPDALVRRVMENLPAAEGGTSARKVTGAQGLVAGLLGTLTVTGGLVATGSAGTGPPMILVLLSLCVGMASTVLQMRPRTWAMAFDSSESS
jgi:hypothetical protein